MKFHPSLIFAEKHSGKQMCNPDLCTVKGIYYLIRTKRHNFYMVYNRAFNAWTVQPSIRTMDQAKIDRCIFLIDEKIGEKHLKPIVYHSSIDKVFKDFAESFHEVFVSNYIKYQRETKLKSLGVK